MVNPRFLSLIVMTFTGAAMRLVPHPPNFTPIAAMALFAGAHFSRKRHAFAVPLLAMFLSDLVISGGYHALMPVVYGCFAGTVGLGLLVRRRRTPFAVGGAALAGFVLFFVVTNFGVWLVFGLYPKSLAGLISCYVAAIPFFRHTLAGDALFTVLLFGGFALAERFMPVLREERLVQSSA